MVRDCRLNKVHVKRWIRTPARRFELGLVRTRGYHWRGSLDQQGSNQGFSVPARRNQNATQSIAMVQVTNAIGSLQVSLANNIGPEQAIIMSIVYCSTKAGAVILLPVLPRTWPQGGDKRGKIG